MVLVWREREEFPGVSGRVRRNEAGSSIYPPPQKGGDTERGTPPRVSGGGGRQWTTVDDSGRQWTTVDDSGIRSGMTRGGAGIRQAFPMGRPSKQAKWNQEALRGLTDKVGRTEDTWCGLCEEGIAQNAAHLLRCTGVADGTGRKWEQIW
ncbi:hypothetical protein EV426DRAFT_706522 [Tirmania nivea]|nr:hypothetical protein EV426DRAFT_706522 [Tirmania nivea]